MRIDIYKKTIYDIDYNKLKEIGIKLLIFDLDETLYTSKDNNIENTKLKEFITNLKEDFDIIILSNNLTSKVKRIGNYLELDYINKAMKPFTYKMKIINKKYNYNNKQISIIGDKIHTDILFGNKTNIYTILVDPIDENLTKRLFNRKIDKIFLSSGRGVYYG